METDETPTKNPEKFSEALFTYLWFTENLVSGSTAAESLGEMSETVTEAAKAVVFLSALIEPTFNLSMDDFFKRNEMTRRNVFTFITVYCFSHHQMNDDVFAVMVNTCTFIYRLVIFCQHRGQVEYIEFAPMCWNELFHIDIKDEFFAKGGWEEFDSYLKEKRYLVRDKASDPKVFANFLRQINYLFPKLDIDNEQGYGYCFSPAAALSELEAAATVSLLASTSDNPACDGQLVFQITSTVRNDETTPKEAEVAASACQDEDLRDLMKQPYDYDDDNERPPDAYVLNASSGDSDSEEDDSDEELFQRLMQFGLASINRLSNEGPQSDCVGCQVENGDRTCDDISELPGGKLCLKHHPDSFFYLVTKQPCKNSVVVDLCHENEER